MATPEHIKETFNALLDTDRADLASLKPTQIAVGMKEVEHKRILLRGLAKHLSTLGDYLLQKPILVVRGPQNSLYVIDHHHLALALLKEGYKTVPIKVAYDFSDCTEKQFWKKMRENNLLHLEDENGQLKSIADLPPTLLGMKNDDYRSLAWFVREAGGYTKIDTPYVEFKWAKYFREHIDLATVNKSFHKAFTQAVRLAHDPAATDLPGYLPDSDMASPATAKGGHPANG